MKYSVSIHYLEAAKPWKPTAESHWQQITPRGVTNLETAKLLADEQQGHTTVSEWLGRKVYDNGKPPIPVEQRSAIPAIAYVAPKKRATKTRTLKPVAVVLPKIVRFLEPEIADDSVCPHCGADGKVVHRFEVDDGRTLAAMSGCVKLFPVSPVAKAEQALMKKRVDYRERGWKLPSWDREKEAAIQAYYDSPRTSADERVALDRIRLAEMQAKAWRNSRRGV